MEDSGATVDRRDAAVAAALAGMVVVILGYASGVGITDPSELVASKPPVTAQPIPNEPAPAAPTAAVPTLAGVPLTSYVVSVPLPTVLSPTAAPPTMPAHPDSPSAPSPTASTTCPPSVLDGLPLVGPVVSSVLGAATPLLSGLLGTDPLDCALSARSKAGAP